MRLLGHPKARSKEIVGHDARIVEVHPAEHVVHYLADNEPGSSGSPVFALDGDNVIALHHVGSEKYSEGVLIAPIYTEIKQWLPGGGGSGPNPGPTSTPPAEPTDVPVAWQKLSDSLASAPALPFQASQKHYRIGQEMRLSFDLLQEGYLNVVAVDENGETTVLFPNRYEHDNHRARQCNDPVNSCSGVNLAMETLDEHCNGRVSETRCWGFRWCSRSAVAQCWKRPVKSRSARCRQRVTLLCGLPMWRRLAWSAP